MERETTDVVGIGEVKTNDIKDKVKDDQKPRKIIRKKRCKIPNFKTLKNYLIKKCRYRETTVDNHFNNLLKNYA